MELRADDPALAGHGPARVVELTIEADGYLDLWADSKSVDPFLRVEDADGTLRAEDDNAAGAGRPWIALEVTGGTVLVVHVASSKADATGTVELHVIRWPTSAESREILARAQAGVEEAKAAQAAGDLPGARARIEAVLNEIAALEPGLVVPGIEQIQRIAEDLGWRLGCANASIRALQALMPIAERRYPPDHPRQISIRSLMGGHAYETGDNQTALSSFQWAVASCERTTRDDDATLQRLRSNLAGVLQTLDRPAEARALQEKVLEVSVRLLGPDNKQVQITRTGLANSLSSLGEKARAETLLLETLASCERTLPPDDPLFENVHLILARVLRDLQRQAEACRHYAIGAELRRARLPAGHHLVLTARRELAACRIEIGELPAARAELESTLDDALSAGSRLDTIRSIRFELGRAILLAGDAYAAIVCFRLAEADALQSEPEDSPVVQRLRGNIAVALQLRGDYPQARELGEKSLEAFQRTLPADSREVQYARIGLANTLLLMDDEDSALTLLEKAREAFERTLAPGDPNIAFVLMSTAGVLRSRGQFDRAEELARRNLEIVKEHAPIGSAHLCNARVLLSKILLERGEAEPAYELMQTAVADLSTTQSAGTPLRCEADALLADCAARSGRKERAREIALAAAADLRRLIFDAARNRAPRQLEQLLIAMESPTRVVIALAARVDAEGELDRAAFTLTETMRGAALRRARSLLLAPGDEELDALRARVAKASAEVARRAQDSGAGALPDAVRAKEQAEAELSRKLAGSASEAAAWSADLASAIASRLGDDQAAVAFRSYRYDDAERLVAWVLRREKAPMRVDLGGQVAVSTAIDAWRDALRARRERGLAVDAESNPEPEAGRALRRLVFDPLLAAVGDARRLVIALDRDLHSVPIDALPLERTDDVRKDGVQEKGIDEEPARVGDRFTVEIRPTLWQLVEPLPPLASAPGLLVLGGIEYDASPSEPAAPEVAATDARPAASRGRAEPAASPWMRAYLPLPETLVEARTIDLLFEKSFGEKVESRLLQGGEASRDELVRRAPGARFLHVATHGFFAPESVAAGEPGRVVDTALPDLRGLSRTEQALGLSPLVVCGLALSGANLPHDAHGRLAGIVTGEEIAALDLRACELAVLSACDTGEGPSRGAGQGLASLQQALQLAGARCVITSLWKVPDEATRELMTDFYRRVWVEKKAPGQALWESKQRLREKVDAKGRRVYAPRDWAGWVLSVAG